MPEREPRRDDLVGALEDDRPGTPRQESGIVLRLLDEVERVAC